MISHRLSTLRNASRIIVLKEGMIAEQGNHDHLMALGGVFEELFSTEMDKERVGVEA
jgi:ABC-type multidrug transport system fused ATPase/permease subunit